MIRRRPTRRQTGRRTRGYTLIEQLLAITAAAATSAVALPSLIGLQADADATALARLAGNASAAMAINYGGCLVTQHVPQPGKCTAIDRCGQLGETLVAGVPAGYRVVDRPIDGDPRGGTAGRGNGAEAACVLVQVKSGATAAFVGIAAGR